MQTSRAMGSVGSDNIFVIDGHSNDTVMLHLIKTHCVPLLIYGIEIIHIRNLDERRQLRVAYNSVFRKIFGYRWSESVTALQNYFGLGLSGHNRQKNVNLVFMQELWHVQQFILYKSHARIVNHRLANALLFPRSFFLLP